MIKEVKEFIEAFLEAELKAKTASFKPDIVKSEEAIKELYDYCTKDCFNRLGIIIPVHIWDSEFYEKKKDVQFTVPRHLYKISKYKNIKYGEIYLVYVSLFIDSERRKNYFDLTYCFIVTKLEGQYKIISQWMVDLDNEKKWLFSFGDTDVKINRPGEFIETERYIEPIHDEEGMAKYKRDE